MSFFRASSRGILPLERVPAVTLLFNPSRSLFKSDQGQGRWHRVRPNASVASLPGSLYSFHFSGVEALLENGGDLKLTSDCGAPV
jgi:hypothetical protein